jgi:hypothetical protein
MIVQDRRKWNDDEKRRFHRHEKLHCCATRSALQETQPETDHVKSVSTGNSTPILQKTAYFPQKGQTCGNVQSGNVQI